MHKAMLPCCLTAAMLCAVAATAEGNNAMAIMDFASGQNRDAWLRHPVYGDPSFDTFERLPCNPVVVGEEPYEWPVNGSLFRDPVSGNWYLYAGLYAYGYAVREESRSQCRVYRSTDAGGTWEEVGGIFDDPNFVFDGEVNGLGSYPDTQVTYVWMANTTCASISRPRDSPGSTPTRHPPTRTAARPMPGPRSRKGHFTSRPSPSSRRAT